MENRLPPTRAHARIKPYDKEASMNFFHLSDLHIGLKLFRWDLREDQMYILNQIAELAAREQPDAVVIAGDVYDKAVPSAEAVEVLDGFISRLTEAVPQAELMVIGGNHDSGIRLNCFRQVLARQRLHMAGLPPQRPEEHLEQVTLEDAWGPVHFYLLPFVRPSMVRQLVGTAPDGDGLSYEETVRRLLAREPLCRQERNVLVSHQFYLPAGKNPETVERMDSEIRTVGNIDQVSGALLEPFDYAALGHIHKPMTVGRPCYRYCGTPLACSVSEAGQQKGVVLVEMGPKGTVETRVLPLTPLRQVRVIRGTLAQVLEQGCGDYVSAVLTGPAKRTAGGTGDSGSHSPEELAPEEVMERLRAAFPYLLEVRREAEPETEPGVFREAGAQEALDPMELCRAFLPSLDEEEEALLRDVIRTVQESLPEGREAGENQDEPEKGGTA